MAVTDKADLLRKLNDLRTNPEIGEEEDQPVGEEDGNNGKEGTFDAMWI
jgi:hypothetical protein